MPVFVLLIVMVLTIYLVQIILDMLRQNSYVKNLPRIPFKILLPMLRQNKTTTDIYEYLNRILYEYDGLSKLWMGSRLVVVCADPVNIKTILMSKDCLDKPYIYRMMAGVGNGIFTAQTHQWRPDRKAIRTVFTTSILKTFLPIISDHFKTLVENLEKFVNHPAIDMTNHVFECFFGISTATSLRFDYRSQSGANGKAVDSISRLLQITTDRATAFIFHSTFLYRLSSLYAEEKKHNELLSKIVEKVFSHNQGNRFTNEKETNAYGVRTKPMILIDKLHEMEQRGEMSRERVHDQILTFLIAGTDTTSVTTLNTLLLLSIHQTVQHRLYEEIRATVTKYDHIDYDTLTKLPYMERVLKESMRILPILQVVLRQTEADVQLTECSVPKGTVLLMGFQKMHRDAKIWGSNANEFQPDRFLPELAAQRHPFSYMPFSAGPRNCIGSKLAMISLKMMLCHLLLKYKFTTSMQMRDIVFRSEFLLKMKNKCMLKLEQR